jgi:septal ring factor EnvC (AmiA/AmiB activator)
MKNRIGLVILIVVCLGLLVALISVNKDATKQRTEDSERISTFSNKWVTTSGQLDEQKQVAAMLEKDVDSQKKSLGDVSNKLV